MQAPNIPPTDDDIHRHIFRAILARRLQPGGRLIEEELARAFGVSRTKVRGALARLAQDGIVEIKRNQGASVAAPTRAQIRDVIHCRCLVEPSIAAALAKRATMLDLSPLHDHVAAEHLARRVGDEGTLVQLTGEFHLELAALHGNFLLTRMLRDAEALMCLGILSYGRPDAASCLPDEHQHILEAITSGAGDRAAQAMEAHLHHVAAGMDLEERAPVRQALADALGLVPNRNRAA